MDGWTVNAMVGFDGRRINGRVVNGQLKRSMNGWMDRWMKG